MTTTVDCCQVCGTVLSGGRYNFNGSAYCIPCWLARPRVSPILRGHVALAPAATLER